VDPRYDPELHGGRGLCGDADDLLGRSDPLPPTIQPGRLAAGDIEGGECLAAAGLAQEAGDAFLGDAFVNRIFHGRRQYVHEDGLRVECSDGHRRKLLVTRIVGELREGTY